MRGMLFAKSPSAQSLPEVRKAYNAHGQGMSRQFAKFSEAVGTRERGIHLNRHQCVSEREVRPVYSFSERLAPRNRAAQGSNTMRRGSCEKSGRPTAGG